jgi:hypothetical protein
VLAIDAVGTDLRRTVAAAAGVASARCWLSNAVAEKDSCLLQ